jgi:hypothetical protein
VQITPDGSSGGGSGPPQVEVEDGAAVARVLNPAAPGAPERVCTDPIPFDAVIALAPQRRPIVLPIGATAFGGGVSSGQCAGPTASDLSSLRLPVHKETGGGYDLSGRASFGIGPCSDHTGLPSAIGILTVGRRKPTVNFEIGVGNSGVEFRTRCPGPFAPPRGFATGHAPSSIIGRQRASIPLTSHSSFRDDGYTGQVSSTLTITLSHPRIQRGHQTNLVTLAG